MIRNRYNQVPHLTQDTNWESDKNTIKHHKQEPRGQPFPAGDHMTAMNRRESMKTQDTNDSQKKYRLGTVSKKYFT